MIVPDGKRYFYLLDIVGTVYHLVIYMQSNKIRNVVLMSEFYSALKVARHVSDLIGPSSGAFRTSCISQTLVCQVVRVLPHNKSANTASTKRS